MSCAPAVIAIACLLGPAESALAGHPVITEALFNVPKGADGDANRDGTRSATGDEFVEIKNTTGAPIDLEGYTITNRLTTGDPSTKRGVRFTFPACTLAPGEVAVVFNGAGAGMPGPVGTGERAPASRNEHFAGAWVFSMGIESRNKAFSNSGDFVLLSAPDGRPLECIAWESPNPGPPRGAPVFEVKGDPKGSVVRDGEGFTAHVDADGRACSPGEAP